MYPQRMTYSCPACGNYDHYRKPFPLLACPAHDERCSRCAFTLPPEAADHCAHLINAHRSIWLDSPRRTPDKYVCPRCRSHDHAYITLSPIRHYAPHCLHCTLLLTDFDVDHDEHVLRWRNHINPPFT